MKILSEAGFIGRGRGSYDAALNMNSNNWGFMKGILLAGLFPSICRVFYKKKGQTSLFKRNDGAVQQHAGSVTNPREGNLTQRWAMYYAKMKSSSLFLMDISEVTPAAICLFGGPMRLPYRRSMRRGDSAVISIETGDSDIGGSAALPVELLARPWVTLSDVRDTSAVML